MATINRPDRVTVDSFNDSTIDNLNGNGYFNQITNNLQTPCLNVKGVQLNRANFINSSLQLNDFNGQLLFVYSRNTTTAIPADGSTFKVIRLYPSWYVPPNGYTYFTKNKYFNNVTELVAALNAAAGAEGDDSIYNPSWEEEDVSFSYDQATRKITFTGLQSFPTRYYAPVPSDHPALRTFLSGVNQVRMNGFTSGGTWATATRQPYFIPNNPTTPLLTMNSRLGFALTYGNRGIWWSSNSVLGCATSTGVPRASTISSEADSWPILQGIQNVNVYLNIVNGSGLDSLTGKALIATIPMEAPPLGINSYTLTSLEYPLLSVANEVYTLTLTFTDENGAPYLMPPNYNANFELSLIY